MIKIRLATDKDEDTWNNIILNSPEGVYNCVFEWKRVVERGLGIEAPFVVAEDNNNIVGIYPAFLIKNLQHEFLISSPFSDAWNYCTPYIVPEASTKILRMMIKYMLQIAKTKNAEYLNILPYVGCLSNESILSNVLSSLGFHKANFFLSQIIDLTQGIENLRRNVKKRHRKYIRASMENGLHLVESTNEEGLEQFYKHITELKERKNIYMPPFLLYKNALEILGPKKFMRIYLVKQDDNIIGGLYTTYLKDIVCTASAGCSSEYLHLHPYHSLYWNCMIESKNLGYRKLDTCGLPPNKSGGIYLFKTRFGGEIREVYRYTKKTRGTYFNIPLDIIRNVGNNIKTNIQEGFLKIRQ